MALALGRAGAGGRAWPTWCSRWPARAGQRRRLRVGRRGRGGAGLGAWPRAGGGPRHSTRERRAWLALTAGHRLLDGGRGLPPGGPRGRRPPRRCPPAWTPPATCCSTRWPSPALAGLVRARLRTHATLPWLDGAIAGVGTASAAVALVGGLLAERAGDSPAELLAKIGFPIGDLVLLALVAVMWGLRGMRGERSWYLASGGVAVMAVGRPAVHRLRRPVRPGRAGAAAHVGRGHDPDRPRRLARRARGGGIQPEGGQLVLPWLFAGRGRDRAAGRAVGRRARHGRGPGRADRGGRHVPRHRRAAREQAAAGRPPAGRHRRPDGPAQPAHVQRAAAPPRPGRPAARRAS